MPKRLQKILPHLYLIALILWGGYVVLYYIGTDSHFVLLLEKADWQSIANEVRHPFMRGLYGLVPFMNKLSTQLLPFVGYAVVCGLFYIAAMTYSVLRHGRMYFDMRLSALHIIIMGVGSLWLLFTTLFYAQIPGIQPRLLIEPTPEAYEDVQSDTLVALQDNFHRLEDGGCLRRDTSRNGPGDARVFFYKGVCAQKSFVRIVLSQLGMLIFFVLNFLVVGSVFLWLLSLRPVSRLAEFAMSLSLGVSGVIAALWFFAFVRSLNMYVTWTFLILIPALGYRFVLHWLKICILEHWRFRATFYSISIFFFWLLVSYLAFNFLTVIRPFPIGWDDLGRYINSPRQLSVFNQILPQIPAMQWEYFTSLGFVLFGYFSTFGATLAQQINWLAGLFAVLAVYLCARIVIGPRSGLLAALFYYSLPMVGHFSFADMKTENALLALGTFGLIAIYFYLYGDDRLSCSDNEKAKKYDHRWMFVAGILFAVAFATKPTIILLFLMGGIILTFTQLGSVVGMGSIFFSLALLIATSTIPASGIVQKVTGAPPLQYLDNVIFTIFLLTGLVCYGAPFFSVSQRWIRKLSWPSFRSYILAVFMLLAGFFIFSAPWMVHNMYKNKHISTSTALKLPNVITPRVMYDASLLRKEYPDGSRALPPELAVDRSHEQCIGTSREEELDRYWGYESGAKHYYGLPWRSVMNIDSQGYYLTTSPLLLISLLLLFMPFFWKCRALRVLFYGTALYVVEWVFVANGIPWYGIGMFLGLAVLTEAIVLKAPTRSARIVAGALAFVAIGTAFSLRLWQFSMQQNLYEYAWGKASNEVLREMTIPDYGDIAGRVLELSKNEEYPYLYRMGTFISYFIPRNLEVITTNDNQLEFFNCLNQEGDHALTLRRLRALGFHSIVFDTNTATIEKNEQGTLHKKVERFLAFANDPAIGIIPVVNNPGGGIAYMVLPEPEDIPTSE